MADNLPDLIFADGLNSQRFNAVDENGTSYWFSVRRSMHSVEKCTVFWLADSRGLPLSVPTPSRGVVRTMVSARLARGRVLTDETAEEYNQRTNYGAY